MDSITPITITKEEFNLFHQIDRKLYAILVNDLWRDPLEALQIMALWLWLERAGFYNAVKKILSLPTILINEVADEAWACLKCISDTKLPFSSETFEIPLTHTLMEKEISLQFLRENQLAAVGGIAKVTSDVCIRCLADIMEEALRRNAAHLSLVHSIAQMGMGRENEMVHERPREIVAEIHPDDRTMFVTFSKGYPVAEWEVREFFTRIFGDCIETFYMQEVQDEEQALFARIVFYVPSIIDIILSGVIKAKFTINGKHVWMRKFVPKRPRASVMA